jgi:hypothetical protein
MSDETRVAYPPERKALHAALAAAQGEFPPIAREKTVDTGKYTFSYAPLDAIIAAVRPVLAKHGLAVTQALENMNGQPAIRTQILHSDGERIAASFPLGSVPDSVQQLGSKLTYLRRYALCSMLCLAAEDDDDGQQATGEKPLASRAAPKPFAGAKADEPKPEPGEPLDAGEVVFTFGKYKGQTIAQVAAEDRRYVGWVAHESSNEKIREAALAFLHDEDIPF